MKMRKDPQIIRDLVEKNQTVENLLENRNRIHIPKRVRQRLQPIPRQRKRQREEVEKMDKMDKMDKMEKMVRMGKMGKMEKTEKMVKEENRSWKETKLEMAK